MIPIGTTVYTFRDHPYMVLEGKVLEHHKGAFGDYHVCEWYDPILDQTYRDTCFSPYLTVKDADTAHADICAVFFKHRSV